MHRLVLTRQADRTLRKMPRPVAQRIRRRLTNIAQDPGARHPNVVRLQNRPGYRLRVGSWRVLFDIQDEQLIVLVLRIAPRGEVYR